MAAWHYARNNKAVGPIDESAIRRLIAEGQITRQTLVWRDGWPQWMTAEKAALFRGPPKAPVAVVSEVAQMLADCRAALGSPPRRLSNAPYVRIVPPAWMKKFPRDALWEIYRNQEKLYSHGAVVWAHIVQANTQLFSRGSNDCPASVIYSPNPALDDKPDLLGTIAHSLFAVKGTTQADPELGEFSRMLANERDRAMRLPVPRSLTQGYLLYHTSIMVVRKHLPHGYLTESIFPLLIHPQVTAGTLIVPSQYWPTALLASWGDGQR